MAIGPPGAARAATATSGTGNGTGYDQITGVGQTSSSITVPWTQGLLDSSNKPIAAANADRSSATPTSPLSFMYPDFKNLQVTVSQTQDITHQGVTLTWQGGEPSIESGGGVQGNFLQVMECYGDASTGPSPQGCEYGSTGMLGPKAPNLSIGTRGGDLCPPGAVPSVTSPPASLNGDGPLLGCDPEEPVQGANPPDLAPGDNQDYNIPFVPVTPDQGSPAYSVTDLSKYFDEFTTNEVQEAVTGADGTGQLHFETLTGVEAPALGCGEQESNGKTRNCWLVIVPRGQFEPNGFKINPASVSPNGFLWSSPLSASNWAMRVQIHLTYAPVGDFCPISTQEIPTVGTQIVARAVQSWQLALNLAGKCARVFGYSAVPEATSTLQLQSSGSGATAGLAFTTIPIGSEAARDGTTPPTGLPKMLYAPVAVSAVGFGFNINEATGYVSTPVKLTPELLAKGLTQVYRTDLPDYYPSGFNQPGPAWSVSNPVNISEDPQFQALNPEVPPTSPDYSLAPLLTEDQSALNQQIWQWIQANPAASSWLNNGTTDAANKVAADPDYMALKLGTTSIDSFPRAYAGVLDLGKSATGKEETRRSLDLLPYVLSYDSAAASVLTANNPTTGNWDDNAQGPDNTAGWWDKNGAEALGHILIWGISDTGDLASYGLVDAQLCNNAGTDCIGPSTASITAALDSATPDSTGLLEVNPSSPGSGGYPLVQVTYAAVSTQLSPGELNNYADLIAYAAGAGQKPGVAPGDLPPGYLPLTATLKAQALDVVRQLRLDAQGKTHRSATPSPTATGTGSSTPAPTASSSVPAVGLSIAPPSAELASARTSPEPAGAIRWALLVVVLAGAACAVGGVVLRSVSLAGSVRRRRP